MTRWDLVYKWADPETQSLVDAVTSALENCDRKLAEARSTPAETLDAARRAIEAEIAMASDPDGKDQFEKGALAAYHFALSVLSPSPESNR